jgi:EAL domain-containing protein (putative c-di-GMP-specific phosphodiesterase class I)
MAFIVQSVIELGHNLGLTIVAEGVESTEALDALAGFGCDVAQGYYLSRPMPLQMFDHWLTDRVGALIVDPLDAARIHHLRLGSD